MGREDDCVLISCAEGNIGRAWVNNHVNPSGAIIAAADFCYLLGNIDVNEDVLKVIRENCGSKVIITDSNLWGTILEKKFPDSYVEFTRYAIKKEPDVFIRKRLQEFVLSVEPEYHVVKIDEHIYYKALENGFTADFCCFFSSLNDYMEHGIGYVIVHNDEIIAGASSYTFCKGSIEVTVGTISEYRRKGLALACAAMLILNCLDKHIYPRWDAANIESVALAEKLGYHFEKEYAAYSI